MSKSEILSSAITVLSFCITVGGLGAKLISSLEKTKNKLDFLREELQETQIETRRLLTSLEERLREVELRLAAVDSRKEEALPRLPYGKPACYGEYARNPPPQG